MLLSLNHIFSFFCFLLGSQYPYAENTGLSGVYVYKYYVRPHNSQQLQKIFPDDSVFYHKGFGIEKVMGINDLVIDNQIKRSEKTKAYYFIDFQNEKFFKMDSIDQIVHIAKPNWEAISKKQYGIQIDFPYYNGEKYLMKDTVVGNKAFKLVRYKSMGKYKEAIMTFYLQSNMEGPVLFSNIETKFNGRIRMINSEYPDKQGEAVIMVDFYRTGTDSFMTRLIEGSINRLKKKN